MLPAPAFGCVTGDGGAAGAFFASVFAVDPDVFTGSAGVVLAAGCETPDSFPALVGCAGVGDGAFVAGVAAVFDGSEGAAFAAGGIVAPPLLTSLSDAGLIAG